MKKLDWKYVPIFRHLRAEHGAGAGIPRPGSGLVTRITPVPDGAEYIGGRPNLQRTLRARCGRRAASTRCAVPDCDPDAPDPDAVHIPRLGVRGRQFCRSNPVTVTASSVDHRVPRDFRRILRAGPGVLQLPGSLDTARARARSIVNGTPYNSSDRYLRAGELRGHFAGISESGICLRRLAARSEPGDSWASRTR